MGISGKWQRRVSGGRLKGPAWSSKKQRERSSSVPCGGVEASVWVLVLCKCECVSQRVEDGWMDGWLDERTDTQESNTREAHTHTLSLSLFASRTIKETEKDTRERGLARDTHSLCQPAS